MLQVGSRDDREREITCGWEKDPNLGRAVASITAIVGLICGISLVIPFMARGAGPAPSGSPPDVWSQTPNSQPVLGLPPIPTSPSGSANLTDASHLAQIDLTDLDRSEAIDVTSTVFAPAIEDALGPLQDLDVVEYLSPHSALVMAGSLEMSGPQQASQDSDETALLESTVPLLVENSEEKVVPINETLETTSRGIEPVASPTELVIPSILREGVSLPSRNLRFHFEGNLADRQPSSLDGEGVLYPNIAPDTDLSILPTPGGFESLTTLRSPAADAVEHLKIDLPSGSHLEAGSEGAIDIVEAEGRPLASILRPAAIDALGSEVRANMSIADSDTVAVTVHPDPSAVYPLILDPVVESYDWYDFNAPTGLGTWRFSTNRPAGPNRPAVFLGRQYRSGGAPNYGLFVEQEPGTFAVYDNGSWIYGVPRLAEEEAAGRRPTSVIAHLAFTHIGFQTSVGNCSPYFQSGISGAGHWAGVNGQEAKYGYCGNAGSFPWSPGLELAFQNGTPGNRDQSAQSALIGITVGEATSLKWDRSLSVGSEAVELTDEVNPIFVKGATSKWMNHVSVEPLTFEGMDTGLGVKTLTIETPNHSLRTFTNPCLGTVENSCPRTFSGSLQASDYSPATLPQGYNYMPVVVKDVVGNTIVSGREQSPVIRVDHTAPAISLSGPLTNQATLGTSRPRYDISVATSDGSVASPQSGVAKLEVKVDGKRVTGLNCSVDSCSPNLGWTFVASSYVLGPHRVEVVAEDHVGLSTTKVLDIETSKDTGPPSVSVSGSAVSGSGGWLTSPGTYGLTAVSTDGGVGVREINIKIDGETRGEATSQSCSAGGCALNKTISVNAEDLPAGAHQVVVTARDFAGNTSTANRRINVMRQASAGVSEVAAIDEALLAGSGTATPPSMLGSLPYEASLGQTSPDGSIEVTGSGIEGTIGSEVKAGDVVENLSGLPIVMTPVAGAQNTPINGVVAEGDAIAYADVSPGKDLLVRPIRNGIVNVVTAHTQQGLSPITWEIASPEPFHLEERSDGGVNIIVAPSIPVPNFSGSAGEDGSVSSSPRVVASLAKPTAVDGAGRSQISELRVAGSRVELVVKEASEASYPIAAELSLHITGPLQAWYPQSESVPEPSTKPLSGVGASSAGPVPIADYWTPGQNSSLTAYLAESHGEYDEHSVPFPSTYEGVVVHVPTETYAPAGTPPAYRCFLGVCSGAVNCGVDGPREPIQTYAHVMQTYGTVKCTLVGDKPPGFTGVRGGVCLQKHIPFGDHFVWEDMKCNSADSPSPDWTQVVVVNSKCDNGVLVRGDAYAGPATDGMYVFGRSYTAPNRC